jgi:hypothetical protein
MSDPHDDTYDSVPLRTVGQITGPIVPIRDDTAEPFPSGNGPLTARIDAWPSPEPYPLHSFEMPPPRASRPCFVPVNLARAVIDAHQQGNQAAFSVAIEQLADAIDGGRNMNSGNFAPIQGDG